MLAGGFNNSDAQREASLFASFQISQIILCSIFALLLPVEFYGLAEFLRNGGDKRHYRDVVSMRVCLFMSGVLSAVAVGFVTTTAFSTQVDPVMCDFLTKSITGSYLIAVLFTYIFLLQKAKLVGKFEVNDRFYQKVFRIAQFAITGLVPVAFIVSEILTYGKVTATEAQRCMQLVPMWFLWFFDCGNVLLSITLIYLFISPIHKSVQLAGSDAKEMKRVYIKNATISSLAVVLTFCTVTTFNTLHQLAELHDVDELYTISLAVMCWDVVILGGAARLTTNIWLPLGLRKYWCKTHGNSATLASTSPNRTSKLSKVQQQVQVKIESFDASQVGVYSTGGEIASPPPAAMHD